MDSADGLFTFPSILTPNRRSPFHPHSSPTNQSFLPPTPPFHSPCSSTQRRSGSHQGCGCLH
ncbi:hypothetical protein CsatB_007806 [Cannabis sativa]